MDEFSKHFFGDGRVTVESKYNYHSNPYFVILGSYVYFYEIPITKNMKMRMIEKIFDLDSEALEEIVLRLKREKENNHSKKKMANGRLRKPFKVSADKKSL